MVGGLDLIVVYYCFFSLSVFLEEGSGVRKGVKEKRGKKGRREEKKIERKKIERNNL